jgi:hypothetical protein
MEKSPFSWVWFSGIQPLLKKIITAAQHGEAAEGCSALARLLPAAGRDQSAS